jgi:hypothetical protein
MAFVEDEFFRAIARSSARALLIGRRALVALGFPLLTVDYDFWVHPEDVGKFNEALRPFDLRTNRSTEEIRQTGRYVLENDEIVDVLAVRHASTVDGRNLSFEDLWDRHITLESSPGVFLALPCIDDLIATKHIAARPKDAEDVRLLETIRRSKQPPGPLGDARDTERSGP